MDEPNLICFVHECSVLRNHDEGLRRVEFLGHLLPGSIRVTLPKRGEMSEAVIDRKVALHREHDERKEASRLSFSPVIFCISWADLIPCIAVPGG